jgi:hypothetical protein
MVILGAARITKNDWAVLIYENGQLRFAHRKSKGRPKDAPKYNLPYEHIAEYVTYLRKREA